MKRFLCCLGWLVLSPILIIIFYLCMVFGAFFFGPREAARRCQPYLDKINELAACCSGKE